MLYLTSITGQTLSRTAIIFFKISNNKKKLNCFIKSNAYEQGYCYYKYWNISLGKEDIPITDKILNILNNQSSTVMNILNTEKQTFKDLIIHIKNLTDQEKEFLLLRIS